MTRRLAACPPLLVLLLSACGVSTGSGPTTAGATAAPSATAATTDPEPSGTAGPSLTPAASATPAPEPLAWRQIPAEGPSAREDHTWTVAGDGRTALLFGGRDGATTFGDLWSFDLESETWTELAPAGPAPSARFGHEAVWTEDAGLVVFAGQAGPTFFNDLWAYDASTNAWRALPSGGDVPVARYGSCAGIGPDGRLWISHGFTSDGVRFSDTRAYDFAGGTWTDETPAGARPVERCLHGCWWTDEGGLALFAGQTTGTLALGDRWTLTDGAWAPVEGRLPPDRNLYARARVEGGTVILGGQAVDGSFLSDLWLLADDGTDAEQLDAGTGPVGRAGGELVRDRDRLLLFGGRTADGALADVWELTGTISTP